MLSQFSREDAETPTLADLGGLPPDVYPVGRLDKDSEGLLLITNDKILNHKLLNPKFAHDREYWVQVEGTPTTEALQQLQKGVIIQGYKTLPAKAILMQDAPSIPERNPPIRVRLHIPTSWLTLSLVEGKNRQVRKMTAAVGFPTLRLIRARIEGIYLGNMLPGEVKEMDGKEVYRLLFK